MLWYRAHFLQILTVSSMLVNFSLINTYRQGVWGLPSLTLLTTSTLVVSQGILQSKTFATFKMAVAAGVLDHYVLFDAGADFHFYSQLWYLNQVLENQLRSSLHSCYCNNSILPVGLFN